MKLRKTLAVLLGAAILTSAAVPIASAESADFSILPPNYESLIIADSENVTADVTENGPMTLTLSGSNSHSLVLMMWNNGTVENPFFNLAELPYLNWDISGNANWGVTVRYNDGSSPNTMVQMYTIDDSTPEGFAPGKGSLNFRDLIINNDKYEYLGDDMEMIAVVFDIFGDPGDSVTFNQVYFGSTPIEEGGDNTQPTTDDTTAPDDTDATTGSNDGTTAAPTTGTTTAATTKKANPSTGEASQAVVAALVLTASAAGVLVGLKRKK